MTDSLAKPACICPKDGWITGCTVHPDWEAVLRDLNIEQSRATCETAGLAVIEPRTEERWILWGFMRGVGAKELANSWPVLRALGLILPDDGETK